MGNSFCSNTCSFLGDPSLEHRVEETIANSDPTIQQLFNILDKKEPKLKKFSLRIENRLKMIYITNYSIKIQKAFLCLKMIFNIQTTNWRFLKTTLIITRHYGPQKNDCLTMVKVLCS